MALFLSQRGLSCAGAWPQASIANAINTIILFISERYEI